VETVLLRLLALRGSTERTLDGGEHGEAEKPDDKRPNEEFGTADRRERHEVHMNLVAQARPQGRTEYKRGEPAHGFGQRELVPSGAFDSVPQQPPEPEAANNDRHEQEAREEAAKYHQQYFGSVHGRLNGLPKLDEAPTSAETYVEER